MCLILRTKIRFYCIKLMFASPRINLYSGNYGEATISNHIVGCYLFPGRCRIRHWQGAWGTWCILLNSHVKCNWYIVVVYSTFVQFSLGPSETHWLSAAAADRGKRGTCELSIYLVDSLIIIDNSEIAVIIFHHNLTLMMPRNLKNVFFLSYDLSF